MSVALRVFHANPIVRSDPAAAVPWELTLTMEHRSYDEMSRLWQATTAPLRMSQVYRAAVVFIDPDTMPEPAPPVTSVSVPAGLLPASFPVPGPAVFGTFREGSYLGPAGVVVPFSQSPATVAAGQTAWLLGTELGLTGVSDHVYLRPAAGGAESDVSAWVQAADSSTARFAFTLPPAAGAAPAGAPDPGVYQLRAGSGPLGSSGATRSGSTPVSVAARVNPPGASPPADPVLTGLPPFTVTGTGFVPGATEVLVGTVALTPTTGSPGPGQVSVDPAGGSFSFSPPAGPAGTVLPVRVRVSGIESDPAVWVTL